MEQTGARGRFAVPPGLDRVETRGGTSELRLTVQPEHLNALGVVHGGVLATLADEAIGRAVVGALPTGAAAVTAELHVHFLLPARGPTLVARARIWRVGRRLVTGEAVLEEIGRPDGTGVGGGDLAAGPAPRVVARADGTWAVLPDRELPAE